ncbi:zinc finger protein VAR3, chloroplastic [Fagus crenata]
MSGGATRFLTLLNTTTNHFPLLLFLHHHRCPSLLLLRHHKLLRRHYHPLNLSPSPPIKPSHHPQLHTRTAALRDDHSSNWNSHSHPWPEWSTLLDHLSLSSHFNSNPIIAADDEFTTPLHLPDHFMHAATACLAFARQQPNILGLLSRRDIEVVVENGQPFLFKNCEDSVRRMRSFLGNRQTNVLDTDIAHTVDLMKFILSYASNPSVTSERNNSDNRELVESSIRSLLSEFTKLSYSTSESNSFGSLQNQSPYRFGQAWRPVGQKIEMKRGDWICTRCSFMNFARNMKCLECEETRPKRELTGGEWECPQCDFYNYGRNMVCLRCDCKRPGEVSFGTTNTNSGIGYGNGKNTNKVDIDSRLAANEEKAQRWFSKVSQLDSASDMSSAITDEDFPEIMPLRKGVNRFVVSTRKTPLERRLANAQQRRNLGNDGTPEGNDSQGAGANMTTNRNLDEILGRTPDASEFNNNSITVGQNPGSDSPQYVSGSTSQYGSPRGSNSNFVPFVPLPADMFAKKPENSKAEGSEKAVTDNQKSVPSNTIEWTGNVFGSNVPDKSGGRSQHTENTVRQSESNDKEKEQDEKSERWFKKVAELHNVTDLASAISDEDFPEIMPMRKGENRFVVSKKKDRSLTSPAYKRRMAMEQGSSTNFVPFAPFPPDYFAKKDKPQPDGADSANNTGEETSSVSAMAEKSYDARPKVLDGDNVQQTGNQHISLERRNAKASGENLSESKTSAVYREPTTGNSTHTSVNSQSNSKDSVKENTVKAPRLTNSSHPSESRNTRESWTGKSLEGSLVKEPNPLDMSEEAKAERWFRRVAEIKDISELSQIPDEDFPSIMPMRKGVNRFVVSKRKTPLERRLTSPQYRRNLPTVSSDPVKKENDSN